MESNNLTIPTFIPPPILNLPKLPDKIDKYLEKLIKSKPDNGLNPEEQLALRAQKPEDINPNCAQEGFGVNMTLEIPKEKNNEGKVQCIRCDAFFLAEELRSHKTSHSSEILEFLYLGGLRNANNLKELTVRTGISYILNVAIECQNYFPGEFEYLKLPFEDTMAFNIEDQLEKAIEFIELAKINKSKILVHCIQGISRSTSVVIAYLIAKENMTLKEAYEHVRSRRDIARPNKNFIFQLINFEKKKRGTITLDINDFVGDF